MRPARHRILPSSGTLLVNTDLHGSGADFDRMRQIWESSPDDTHWAVLGDIVHAPDDSARRRQPAWYDYDDESGRIATQLWELRNAHPDRIHFVLGNHDWAHIGGPRVAKFWDDEAAQLESTLDRQTIATMHELFRNALICLLSPCGVFMAHASPGALVDSLEELDRIDLGGELDDRQRALVMEFTTFYGQRGAVSRSFLTHMSDLSGCDLRMVVHGHDRDEEGWFTHEDTQACPVIFGAPRRNRRYLRLDLAARYDSVDDLAQGREVLRLWDTE